MTLTIPFDLLFSAVVGLGFAACARSQFAGGVMPWGRELAAVLSFEGIIVWPVVLYFSFADRDWSWMYLVDPQRLPWGVSVLVLLGLVALLLGGYLLGWWLVRARRERLIYFALAAASIALGALAIRWRARLLHAGTFAEYHRGLAGSIGQSKLAWSIALCAIGEAVGCALVGLTLWAQGKRFR